MAVTGPDRRRTLGLMAGAAAALALPGCARGQARAERQVLAFHYGWYGPGRGWSVSADGGRNHPNVPEGGLYDSLDPAVVRRQVSQARAAGITGFITSWWGEDHVTDQALTALLAQAGDGFSITAYLEDAGGAPEALAARLRSLHDRFAGHPAWLRLDGRPVLFVFDRVIQQLGLPGWRAARAAYAAARPDGFLFVGPANDLDEMAARREVFDALHVYSMTFVTDGWPPVLTPLLARRWYARRVEAQRGLAVSTATVLPGFDDRRLDDRTGRRPVTPRRDGRTYRDLWRAARAAEPDWVLIVSWNEWFEASEIEPSVEHGRRELETTAEMARDFRR